jgi:hypothetical protein
MNGFELLNLKLTNVFAILAKLLHLSHANILLVGAPASVSPVLAKKAGGFFFAFSMLP